MRIPYPSPRTPYLSPRTPPPIWNSRLLVGYIMLLPITFPLIDGF